MGLPSFTVSMHIWNGITTLNLSENDLTELAAEICGLIGLKKLKLHNNQLTVLPQEISQLTNLHYLNVSNNQLTQLPAEIGQLTKLERLEAANNKLTEIPVEISNCQELDILYIENNELDTIPDSITELPLTELDVSNNNLTTMPRDIGEMQGLTDFRLSGNPLLWLPDSFQLLDQDCYDLEKVEVPLGLKDFLSSGLIQPLSTLLYHEQAKNEEARTNPDSQFAPLLTRLKEATHQAAESEARAPRLKRSGDPLTLSSPKRTAEEKE